MATRILCQTDFTRPSDAWILPEPVAAASRARRRTRPPAGYHAAAGSDRSLVFNGQGVHTRNGDAIELQFQPVTANRGAMSFGFTGGMEQVLVKIDFRRETASLFVTDWSRNASVATAPIKLTGGKLHALRIEKTEGRGRLVKMANIRVLLDGKPLLAGDDLNVLPELGVQITVEQSEVRLRRFVHRGAATGICEYLHIGGWQMPNVADLDANLSSICRGLTRAAEAGVRLLVTPETSLTGLFPGHAITKRRAPIQQAERKLRRFIRDLPNAPYVVVGLPVWQSVADHRLKQTRYNTSRVYDPDGHIHSSGAKIHSCEAEFWHGYRLNEFEVDGAPIAMHICHDERYPDVWTLPVMFGARVIIHPSNGGLSTSTVDAYEAVCTVTTRTSHAFYLKVNGGGQSCLVSPQKHNNLLAAPDECRRDNPAFPMTGPISECLFSANIRVHDAFGYWPVRSFRASESVAESYVNLYRACGGRA